MTNQPLDADELAAVRQLASVGAPAGRAFVDGGLLVVRRLLATLDPMLAIAEAAHGLVAAIESGGDVPRAASTVHAAFGAHDWPVDDHGRINFAALRGAPAGDVSRFFADRADARSLAEDNR